MRTLEIHRPKRMMACAMKVTVEIDGKKAGKLANGSELSIPIDEQAHEIRIHMGMLAGKKASSQLTIPAGSFSYALQTEMMEITNGTKPVLLPYGMPDRREPTRLVQLLVFTLTSVLMEQKLRDVLAAIPSARLQLVVGEQQWELVLFDGSVRKSVFSQPYSTQKGNVLALTANYIEHMELRDAESREKFADKIFAEYLQYLPDYQQVGRFELMLR